MKYCIDRLTSFIRKENAGFIAIARHEQRCPGIDVVLRHGGICLRIRKPSPPKCKQTQSQRGLTGRRSAKRRSVSSSRERR